MTTSTRSPDTADDLMPLAATAATSSTSLPGTSDNLILLSATGRRNLEKYKLYQLVTDQFNAIRPTATMYTAPINYVSRPPRTTHRKKSDVPRSLHLTTTQSQRSRLPAVPEIPVTAAQVANTALTPRTSWKKDAQTAPTFTPTTPEDLQIPVKAAQTSQIPRTAQQPRSWLTQTSHPKKAARRPPRTAMALDWSMAKH